MRFIAMLAMLALSVAASAAETAAPVYQMQFDLGIGSEPPRPMSITSPAGEQFALSVTSEPPAEGDLRLVGMIREAGESKRGRQLIDFSLATTQFISGQWKQLSDSAMTTELGAVATMNIDGGADSVSLRASFTKMGNQAALGDRKCEIAKDGSFLAKDGCCTVGCPNPPPGRKLTCCTAYGCCSDAVCGAHCCVQ